MEEIIRTYGEFLLDGMIVAILILGFGIMHTQNGEYSVLAMIGTKISVDNDDNTYFTDYKNGFMNASQRRPPEIWYRGGALECGAVLLTEYVIAQDTDGAYLPLKVTGIRHESGRECLADYNSGNGEMYFRDSGCYLLDVEATDGAAKTTRCCIRIPVNP